jgi:hypothetical protein
MPPRPSSSRTKYRDSEAARGVARPSQAGGDGGGNWRVSGSSGALRPERPWGTTSLTGPSIATGTGTIRPYMEPSMEQAHPKAQ